MLSAANPVAEVRRRAALNQSVPRMGDWATIGVGTAYLDEDKGAHPYREGNSHRLAVTEQSGTVIRGVASSDGSSVPEARLSSGPAPGGRPTGMTDAEVAGQARGRKWRQSARGLRYLPR